eukprot:2943397-Heterocapsa_arctica.AAC.1
MAGGHRAQPYGMLRLPAWGTRPGGFRGGEWGHAMGGESAVHWAVPQPGRSWGWMLGPARR